MFATAWMKDNHASHNVTVIIRPFLIQKNGGFAFSVANREGPFRFFDIGSRVSPEVGHIGGDGGIRTLGTGFTSTTV